MANAALLKRPYQELQVAYRPGIGRLWVAATVIERPVGNVARFGALFVTAASEEEALTAAEAILEESFPEGEGYRRSFDVVPVKHDVLETGLRWYRGERAKVLEGT